MPEFHLWSLKSHGHTSPCRRQEHDRARTSEAAFETAIESRLLANGYTPVAEAGFDRARAIFPETILDFIHETQPKEWAKLEALHGVKTGEQITTDLCKWMDSYGSLARSVTDSNATGGLCASRFSRRRTG